MKKILVPTDFSKLSNFALDFASHLAKALKAEVALVHFEDLPLDDTSLHLSGEAQKGGVSEDSLYNAQLFRANNQKLEASVDKFSAEGIAISGKQLGGGFLKGIEHYVQNNQIDLVVIGTSGEESLQEFFSGNHTEQLIEHLDIPVLSVQHEVDTEIHDIVMGLDLQDENYSKRAFEMVKVISEGLDARLHIVDVVKSEIPEGMMLDMNKLAREAGLQNYVVDAVHSRHENEALMGYADFHNAGLIITLSEARSGIYRFFQHSFATKMTKTSSVPVLTINKRHLN